MKVLRHPPLLFWLVALGALLGVLGVAYTAGLDGDAAVVSQADDGFDDVASFRYRLSDLPHLAAEGGEPLAEWASQTSVVASAVADGRVDAGAGDDDLLVELFTVAAGDAAELADAATEGDRDAVHAHAARLLMVGDNMAAVVAGFDPLPVPPAPAGGLAPIDEHAPGPVDPDLTEPGFDGGHDAGGADR